MQKRLLALVATVAMVLSLFAGVAFAAPSTVSYTADGEVSDINPSTVTWDDVESKFTVPEGVTEFTFKDDGFLKKATYNASTSAWAFELVPTHKFRLDSTKIVPGTYSFQKFTGAIVKNNNSIAGEAFVVKVFPEESDSALVTVDTDANGYFEFYLSRDLAVQDLSVAATPKASGSKSVVADGTIEVRYNVTITSDRPNLDFAYTGKQEPIIITGKVTDFNGNPVDNASVEIVGVSAEPSLSPFPTEDDGVFVFTTLKWDAAGDLYLKVDGKTHLKGKVAGIVATVSVTPNTTVHTVSATEFKVSGSGFAASSTATVNVYDADGNKVSGPHTVNTDASGKIVDDSAAKFSWQPAAAGVYTLVVTQTNYEAKATITVSHPATYNLIGADALTKLPVGDKTFVFGDTAASGQYRIDLVKYVPGSPTSNDFKYAVLVDGKATALKASGNDLGTTGPITITSTKLAERTIQVIAYAADAEGHYTVEVFNQTFTAKVDGWAVELDTNTLTAGKAYNLTFVVTDKDGAPVNNATIAIVGTSFSVDPSTYNAQNGTYVLKDVKINRVGKYTVEVKLGSTKKAELSLFVVGDKLYSVTSDVATLLQGKAEDVKLTVTQDGAAVTPARVKLVDKDGNETELGFSVVEAGVVKIKEAVNTAGTYTLRVENFNGTVCGETTIEVVAPKLVLVDETVQYLTNNLKTTIKFKVVDPRDNSVIKENITTDLGSYIPAAEFANEAGAVLGNPAILLGAEEHVLTVLVKVPAAKFEEAEKAGKTVKLTFKVGSITVNGGFEVKDATITSDPEMIIIGAKNNLTLTYLDANGKPIAGKTVKANNADLGKTDDNGQVIYPAGIVAEAVEVKADTDVTDKPVVKSIKIGYDFEAPQVTYEVDGNKATLIITDNVRLVRVNIDGKDIDFWPGARYEHVVTLNPGVNKVRVKAQDSNDNVLDEVVEIEYKTDSIVLKDDKVQRQGDYLFVQARQFEEFGAKFAWNGETRTATFVIGDDKVEVTIGSTTAVVNGEAVTMPVAAFIADGRTYVPVRFVSENLGWNVHWAQGDIVTITLP